MIRLQTFFPVLVLAFICPAGAAVVDATFTSPTSVPVTAASYSAAGKELHLGLAFAPATGTDLTVVNNTGLDFIDGRFSNLAHGQNVVLAFNGFTYSFVANYHGGTGNDLVLEWAANRAYAWGANEAGQLGNNSSVPVAVSTTGVLAGRTVSRIAAGAFHSLVLCTDGTLVSWGWGYDGALGNNSIQPAFSPVLCNQYGDLNGKQVTAVSGGRHFSLVLCADGKLVAFGANGAGQLANAAVPYATAPLALAPSALPPGHVFTTAVGSPVSYHAVAVVAVPQVAGVANLSGLVPSSGSLTPEFASH